MSFKIGLLAGAFNPPHWGHHLITQQCLDFCPFDQIWLMPAHKYNPDFDKKLVSFDQRVKMTKFLARPNIKVSSFEQKVKGVSYSYQVIKQLKKTYPALDFSFIIGSDNLSSFNRWYKHKALLDLIAFYVFPRQKIVKKNLFAKMKPIYSPLLTTTSLSSTQVKQEIKNNNWQKLNTMMPGKLAKYIKAEKLYLN